MGPGVVDRAGEDVQWLAGPTKSSSDRGVGAQ